MKNYRVNTTISMKHHAILKKYTKKYGTQRSVLEHALELNQRQNREFSEEEKIWMSMYQIKNLLTVLPEDLTRLFLNNSDINRIQDYVKNETPVEFAIEWFYTKPLKECTLIELVEGIILNIKMQSSAKTINYQELDEYYTINILHELGLNGSKTIIIMNESALNNYGANFERNYSERNVFFKIYK
ncbi:MAG: hypothetical protein LUQ24_04155 [Methanobacterium sp.]|nr:hypothetical protein [Methanobacterium sp.]